MGKASTQRFSFGDKSVGSEQERGAESSGLMCAKPMGSLWVWMQVRGHPARLPQTCERMVSLNQLNRAVHARKSHMDYSTSMVML